MEMQETSVSPLGIFNVLLITTSWVKSHQPHEESICWQIYLGHDEYNDLSFL